MVKCHRNVCVSRLTASVAPPIRIDTKLVITFNATPIGRLRSPTSTMGGPVVTCACTRTMSGVKCDAGFRGCALDRMVGITFKVCNITPIMFVGILSPTGRGGSIASRLMGLSNKGNALSGSNILCGSIIIGGTSNSSPKLAISASCILTLSSGNCAIVATVDKKGVARGSTALGIDCARLSPNTMAGGSVVNNISSGAGTGAKLRLLSSICPHFGLIPKRIVTPKFDSSDRINRLVTTGTTLVDRLFGTRTVASTPASGSAVDSCSTIPR